VPERYGVILLAAGLSSRFARGDKLLHLVDGMPLLARAAAPFAAFPLEARIAVTGPDATGRRAILAAYDFDCVENPQPSDGMGRSLALGAQALPPGLDGVFVALGDMPDVPPTLLAQLQAALRDDPGARLAAPVHRGQRGHPVLFGRDCLPALAALQGDQGARSLLQAAGPALRCVVADEPGTLRDIDTVEDLIPDS
jgi:molybdenum cofactor cytidylyltransferase